MGARAMKANAQYDAGNVFARIIRGEMPSARVYEDEVTLAFMDAFPQAEGHVLVIAKTSTARSILEIDAAVLARLIKLVRRIARAVQEVLMPDGVIIAQLNGEAAGQTIGHFHFHVIPCWSGQPLDGRLQDTPVELARLQRMARKLAAALE